MIDLRRAEIGDLDSVRTILAGAANDLTKRFGEGHWSIVRSVATLRKHVSSGTIYVVEANAFVLGTLRLSGRKVGYFQTSWFAQPDDTAIYLMDMAVAPDHQRRGVGRGAMAAAEELAGRAGSRAIRLDAYRGPAGAGEFYRKCGYRLVHAGEFRGVPLDYFEKLIPDPVRLTPTAAPSTSEGDDFPSD